ncbi:MAG: hypothetical protein JJT94_03730 [Bernardetiaceae bacterium]|nr:hypothetical protein [Bernardetiaceae bacterium]
MQITTQGRFGDWWRRARGDIFVGAVDALGAVAGGLAGAAATGGSPGGVLAGGTIAANACSYGGKKFMNNLGQETPFFDLFWQ